MLPLKRTYVNMDIIAEPLFIILIIFQALILTCIIYGLLYYPFLKIWKNLMSLFPCQSVPKPDFEKGKTSSLRQYEEDSKKKINWVWKLKITESISMDFVKIF